jgi:hypothetical protein
MILGLLGAARVPVGDGEVAARLQGVGVVRAQDAFAGSQDLLIQAERLLGRRDPPAGWDIGSASCGAGAGW